MLETTNYSLSANNYLKRSTDGMATWSSDFGPVNIASDGIYGLRGNLVNTERIYATWYRITPDDLFGETLVDISTGDKIYLDSFGVQVDTLNQSSTDNYIGGGFKMRRDSGTSNITSIKITETGTISAYTDLSNLDLYYEYASTCSYDANESLFGTATSFNISEEATISGTVSLSDSTPICFYPVLDISSTGMGTIELEIKDPNNDVSVSSAFVGISLRSRIPDPTNVRQSGIPDPVVIDDTVSTTVTRHNGSSPTTVFRTDLIGYTFYVDSNNYCVYKKTEDGGATWGSTVNVFASNTCLGIAIWYDKWTPGLSTEDIHIVYINSADTFYTYLDSSDVLATALNASGANQGGGFSNGQNAPSITVSTTGEKYLGIVDNSDTFVLRCSTGCTTSINNWTEAGTNPFGGAASDWVILMPISNGDILGIWWDVSADDIKSMEFEDTLGSWSGTWSNVDLTADENSTYDSAYAATLDRDTGYIYLAYVDDESFLSDANGDIEVWYYNGTLWTAGLNVLTNDSRSITQLGISYDDLNNTLYVIYSVVTDVQDFTTAAVYYKSLNSSLTTISSEKGSLTLTAEREIYGLRSNLVSTDRLYATWIGAVSDDIFGTTVYDIPSPLSISLSTDGVISYGIVALNTSVINSSDVEVILVDDGPVDLDIRTTNFTQGINTWTLGSGAGSDIIKWEFSKDGNNWSTFLATDPTLYTFDSNVAESGTRNLYLRLTTPTFTSSYQEYSSTVTVVASEP